MGSRAGWNSSSCASGSAGVLLCSPMECDAGVVGWRAGCDDVQGPDLALEVGTGDGSVVDSATEGEGKCSQK